MTPLPVHGRAQTYSRRGDASKVIECKERVYDRLDKEEVLIKVHAAALNPVDWKFMKLLPTFLVRYASVLGHDFSGTVVESRSQRFHAGDNVYGVVAPGAWKIIRGRGSVAQYAISHADTCALRPAHVDATHAAGLALVGCTAVLLANEVEYVRKKNDKPSVLVCGGSSSVGLMLIPILKHKGFRVAATCSQAKKDIVVKRGADETFDYRDVDFQATLVRRANDEARGGAFDCIIDCVDSFATWSISDQIMPLHGNAAYFSVGADLTDGVLNASRRMIAYQFLPTWLGGVPTRFKRPIGFITRALMDELAQLVEQGIVTPVTDSTFTFDETKDAFSRLRSNRATGKVLIQVE